MVVNPQPFPKGSFRVIIGNNFPFLGQQYGVEIQRRFRRQIFEICHLPSNSVWQNVTSTVTFGALKARVEDVMTSNIKGRV